MIKQQIELMVLEDLEKSINNSKSLVPEDKENIIKIIESFMEERFDADIDTSGELRD